MNVNPQSTELNEIIVKSSKTVYSLLSKRGRNIFFPRKGILAQSAQAKGKDINATIGTALEDNGEPLVLDCISKNIHLSKKEAFDYASSYGDIELRKKWKEMIFEKNPSLSGNDTSSPVVTCALTHGLSICGYMFVDEGDDVIIPTPYWENYDLLFENAYGGNIKTFPLFSDNKFNFEGLKENLMSRGEKKVLLLNFPNNPTGYTLLKNEVDKVVGEIKNAADAGKKIAVLIDDAYFGLVYEDEVYTESIFSKLSRLSENILAVKIDGATKEDYAWGFRVGFVTYGIKDGNEVLYKALEDKTAGAIRGNISNAPQISQSLLMHAFKDEKYNAQKKEKYETLKKRCNKVKEILEKHPEYGQFFEPLPFNSGYFMCIKVNVDGEKLRQTLLEDYSTGVILFGKDLVRIAFSATPYEKLGLLFENIFSAAKKVKEEK